MDKVVHFEIPFWNAERAKKFYTKTFGWKLQEFPDMNYTILRTVELDKRNMPKEKGAINGGMMRRRSPVNHPVITISVKSIDKTSKIIKKNGGKLIGPKMEVGTMGFSAYFKDPEGNIIGLWENARQK